MDRRTDGQKKVFFFHAFAGPALRPGGGPAGPAGFVACGNHSSTFLHVFRPRDGHAAALWAEKSKKWSFFSVFRMLHAEFGAWRPQTRHAARPSRDVHANTGRTSRHAEAAEIFVFYEVPNFAPPAHSDGLIKKNRGV